MGIHYAPPGDVLFEIGLCLLISRIPRYSMPNLTLGSPVVSYRIFYRSPLSSLELIFYFWWLATPYKILLKPSIQYSEVQLYEIKRGSGPWQQRMTQAAHRKLSAADEPRHNQQWSQPLVANNIKLFLSPQLGVYAIRYICMCCGPANVPDPPVLPPPLLLTHQTNRTATPNCTILIIFTSYPRWKKLDVLVISVPNPVPIESQKR